MSKNTFAEQYPGYKIIPEKKSWPTWLAVWLAAAILVVGVPGYMIYKLSTVSVPVASMVGNNKFTLATAAKLGADEAASGKFAESAQNFERYFNLGGDEADMMAMYAYSLSQLGRKNEALTWSHKAMVKAPDSKAARMVEEALEKND